MEERETAPSAEVVPDSSAATPVKDEEWEQNILADASNLAKRGVCEAGIEITIENGESSGTKKRKIEGTCDVCKNTEARYCCPRCNTRSCSLGCCKKHKIDTKCSGERQKTAFIPITEFTDSNLISDLHFLEDGLRTAESAHKSLPKSRRRPTKKIAILLDQMESRKITLKILPEGMSRRKNNSSFYDIKKKELFWHVEWRFPTSNVTLSNLRLSENATLISALTAHLTNPKEPIDPYVAIGASYLSIAMRIENTPANNVWFTDFEPTITLKEALEGKELIEFPTFFVLLPEERENYNLTPNNIKQADLFQIT